MPRLTKIAHASSAILAVAGLLLGFGSAPAYAQSEPVALVEEVTKERTNLQLMDYLEAGRQIDLGAEETLRLGYLFSCVEETITGGTVTIGEAQSTVDGGTVVRNWVDCDGGSVLLAEGQDQEAGAAVFRNDQPCDAAPQPDRVVYDVSPLVKFQDTPEAITVTPICEGEDDAGFMVPMNDRIVDFREAKITLEPGRTYRFSTQSRSTIVKISRLARKNSGTIIARLLPM